MLRFHRLILLAFGITTLLACQPEWPPAVTEAYKTLPKEVDFNIHVRPILSDKCFLCHGPDEAKQEAGLRLDLPEGAYRELADSPGKFAITPKNLRKSEVIHRILSDDPEYMMPTPASNIALTDYEKAILIKWIEKGAEYKPHWAFIPPQKTAMAAAEDQARDQSPIDQLVRAKLQEKGMTPAAPAEKALLLRRLSFDLSGLPPTPNEIKNFLNDDSPNAYEKQVDRLLASPHYGERMAMDWLDLARFADTHGYLADRYRDMSPWRDWVIQSFNDNLPYDKFITWQLAGDLLPNPTKEQILATGFNRLHPQNLEDGIIDEEFRSAYVSDRTDVLGQGLMGLTVACAKCHDHKYDPISQENYYQLYSFFNNINESGLVSWEGATPVPTLMLPTDNQAEILAYLEKKIATQDSIMKVSEAAEAASFKDWLAAEQYQSIPLKHATVGKIAHFELENQKLTNRLNPRQKAKMNRMFSKSEQPQFAKGKKGKGLLLDGEAWLDCDKLGLFKRSESFSIQLQVQLPKALTDGYLFHKGMGTRIHGFRGYHLYLKDNKLELMMAHTWPDNAIVEYADVEIPREEWVSFTFTYDGSSSAAGCKLYMNGEELKTRVEIDNLYKDIIFYEMVDPIYPKPIEPGLKVGARWRGKGIKGAIVDELMIFDREITAIEVLQINQPEVLKAMLSKDPAALSAIERSQLSAYYLTREAKAYQQQKKKLVDLRTTYTDTIENVQEVMVMQEMAKPRKTYILERGQYDVYGKEVFPNVPERILPMADDLPKNRLGLAQWLTQRDHPLTARVAVNRYWQLFFGRGLVLTTEDFGSQGQLPSHPALLDLLAIQFIESGWDVKQLAKTIVMSSTYQQSSVTSKQLRKADPDNRWLARGPALRLSGEMIRDNALLASGLLYKKIGGESVKPYQPAGLWKMNNDTYYPDSGLKLYRRSLYTFWKRSVPHPTLATFDAPDRSECTVRRQKTNTPLQALVLMNDPAFVEASRVIGQKISRAKDIETGISQAFLQLTGRPPQAVETALLLQTQIEEYQEFSARPKQENGWLSSGAHPLDEDLDPALIMANAVIASIIMNSDASITKR